MRCAASRNEIVSLHIRRLMLAPFFAEPSGILFNKIANVFVAKVDVPVSVSKVH